MSDEESDSDGDYYNVILLGDSGVGKTTFFVAVRDERITKNTQSTIGVDFAVHTAHLFTGRGTPTQASVQLRDTGGQERFAVLVRSYYGPADAAIIMFDVAAKGEESLKRALSMYHNLRKQNQNNAVVRFVGNKEDLLGDDANKVCERARAYIVNHIGQKLDTAITFTSLHERGFEVAIELLDELVELAVQRRELELQRDKQREAEAAKAAQRTPRRLVKPASSVTQGRNGKLRLKKRPSATGGGHCPC